MNRNFYIKNLQINDEFKMLEYGNTLYKPTSIFIHDCLVKYESMTIDNLNEKINYYFKIMDHAENCMIIDEIKNKPNYYFKMVENEDERNHRDSYAENSKSRESYIIFSKRLKQVNKLSVAIKNNKVEFGDLILLSGIIAPDDYNRYDLLRFSSYKAYFSFEINTNE